MARQRLLARLNYSPLTGAEKFEMFRQKSVFFLALAAIMAVAIACTSNPAPTATPEPTATPVPTATPEPTATPVPVAPIVVDPIADPVGFLSALPAAEASCATTALGGEDRVLAMLESNLGDEHLTSAEADAIDACLSDETVRAVFIGQLEREAGTLSYDTLICIGEKVGGMAAASLFTDEPAIDTIISSLQGVFCLNPDERAALSESENTYGFNELGGVDAIECVVNGVGPTGLTDLFGIASGGNLDFASLGDQFPLMIDCGVINDSQFEELGVSAAQIGCVLSELGEDGLLLLDPTAAEPDLSELSSILAVFGTCGIELQDLLGGSELPINPDPVIDPTDVPLIEIPESVEDIDLPFTDEQIICLSAEIGEDEIANLLAGGAPDLSLFAALSTCEVDIATLLGG